MTLHFGPRIHNHASLLETPDLDRRSRNTLLKLPANRRLSRPAAWYPTNALIKRFSETPYPLANDVTILRCHRFTGWTNGPLQGGLKINIAVR